MNINDFTTAIPNLVLMRPNHEVTFAIFTDIILNFASRQVIISFILRIADFTIKHMRILVTGGCGFIGSHTIVNLLEKGYDVVSVDNLYNADVRVLDGIEKITGKRVRNHAVDLCDAEKTSAVFAQEENIAGVVHFAAYKHVGESMQKPLDYFHNNINSLLNVLRCCRTHNIPNFIFSSSCAVYGNAKKLPVTEETAFYCRRKSLWPHQANVRIHIT